jgi:hypothetical protein
MSIEEIIVILQNKIRALQIARDAALLSGNLESYTRLEAELLGTESSLDKLKTLT